MSKSMQRGPMLALAVLLAAAVPAVQAGPAFDESSAGRKTALAIGSGVSSLFYLPAKALYATGSAITGALVLGFSMGESEDAAGRIARRGFRGDWWVHPDVFTGHRDLEFVGDPGFFE